MFKNLILTSVEKNFGPPTSVEASPSMPCPHPWRSSSFHQRFHLQMLCGICRLPTLWQFFSSRAHQNIPKLEV